MSNYYDYGPKLNVECFSFAGRGPGILSICHFLSSSSCGPHLYPRLLFFVYSRCPCWYGMIGLYLSKSYNIFISYKINSLVLIFVYVVELKSFSEFQQSNIYFLDDVVTVFIINFLNLLMSFSLHKNSISCLSAFWIFSLWCNYLWCIYLFWDKIWDSLSVFSCNQCWPFERNRLYWWVFPHFPFASLLYFVSWI